jgi:hypothetical protein
MTTEDDTPFKVGDRVYSKELKDLSGVVVLVCDDQVYFNCDCHGTLSKRPEGDLSLEPPQS